MSFKLIDCVSQSSDLSVKYCQLLSNTCQLTSFTSYRQLLLLVVTTCPSLADYGVRDVSKYRLNAESRRYPVRSPDELFGFGDQVPADFNPDANINGNNNINQMNVNTNNINNNNMNGNSDENNIISNSFQNQVDNYINGMMRAPLQTSRTLRKNRVKSGYRRPMASKMIFSQYMSPQYLESEESYSLKPRETFKDPYLSQLMPHILATAEHMALEKEAEESMRSYAKAIPVSKIMRILRSSDFFRLTDSQYGLKKRSD